MEIGNKVKLKGMGLLVAHLLGNEGNEFIGEIVGTDADQRNTKMYIVKFAEDFKGHKNGTLKLYEENLELVEDSSVDVDDELEMVMKFMEMFGFGVDSNTKKESEEFKPYIQLADLDEDGFVGYIGDKSNIKDINNSTLYVGDIVLISIENKKHTSVIGYDDMLNKYIAIGVGTKFNKDGEYTGLTLTKLIDHSIAHEYSDIIDSSLKIEYVMSGEDND